MARLIARCLQERGPVAALGVVGLGSLALVMIPVRLAFGFVGMAVVGAFLFGLLGAFGLAVLLCAAGDKARRRKD